MKRIAMLTSGGAAPGMNAAARYHARALGDFLDQHRSLTYVVTTPRTLDPSLIRLARVLAA